MIFGLGTGNEILTLCQFDALNFVYHEINATNIWIRISGAELVCCSSQVMEKCNVTDLKKFKKLTEDC